MAIITTLHYSKGHQFFTQSGQILSGGCLFFTIAGTTTPQTVYLDPAGTIPYSSGTAQGFPYIQLDSAGRLDNPIYLGQTYPYKETLTDSTGATTGLVGASTIFPWPWDQIQIAPPAGAASTFATPQMTVLAVTSASSPVTLTTSNVGNFYDADCSGGNVQIILPDATSAAKGVPIGAKKTDSSANTVTISTTSAQTIDGSSTNVLTAQNQDIVVFADGANWKIQSSIPAPVAAETTTPVLGSAQFVKIANNSGTPNTKADITISGQVICVNSSGLGVFFSAPGTITCNLATTGLNALDTGSVTNGAAVYFYGISNGTLFKTLASVTSPIAGGSASLPAGYTYQVFLGSMMVDGSGNLRPTSQTGKRVKFTSSPPNIGTGTITYANFFPSASEAGLLTADLATIANAMWSVADMDGITIGTQGPLPTGDGDHVLALVPVQNTGGTTFTTSGTNATFTAYGWIERANVT
jgi:hypothetical protein